MTDKSGDRSWSLSGFTVLAVLALTRDKGFLSLALPFCRIGSNNKKGQDFLSGIHCFMLAWCFLRSELNSSIFPFFLSLSFFIASKFTASTLH